ncbi:tyrosine-type recombinase/integrase [Pseudonocardia sp. EV170527-09]|uniref:tyrosine-type recombinase/integrase n=1 Tax=Pseudonocardia sp. EV170527-09 TaxID=2603411 RepID=UPI0011F11263|nr:tyrosine-type recombinase/integrase [Pseudonocardia sp. EV170527-09]KAA1011549.1 tyrosine-type recombinase/integrase [Pseudonocardia sp. EV170527-09]
MASQPARRKRHRGEVEVLPSGSFRVRVYAGVDPLSGKRHYLRETVPAGPNAAKEAEKTRTRLLAEVDERRNPRTSATVNQLLDRYLSVVEVEESTRTGYESMCRNYIRPVLGELRIGRIDGETLDAFFAELRRCRRRCDRRARTDHRMAEDHDCDRRCKPHTCRPLGGSYMRQIHNVLNGAFTRAVRWRWVGTNPVRQAEAPPQPTPDPQPPTASQAAAIANEAWGDPHWGMLVWLAMTTGARRGELCALRWDRIDFTTGVVDIGTSIGQVGARTWEKTTKTHQRRRIVVDPQTLALLQAYLRHSAETAAGLGVELRPDSFVFTRSPDGSTWLKPDSLTQRYARMCARLGWNMHLHQLRHYSATELIAAGVDVRTVAGRLGHGGGGTTTLRVYSAWVAEADQRAAGSLAARLPQLSASPWTEDASTVPELPAPARGSRRGEENPYEAIAADIRAAIRCGALLPGEPIPTVKELARRYEVAEATAHRAVALLSASGEVVVSRGRRARVGSPASTSTTQDGPSDP